MKFMCIPDGFVILAVSLLALPATVSCEEDIPDQKANDDFNEQSVYHTSGLPVSSPEISKAPQIRQNPGN